MSDRWPVSAGCRTSVRGCVIVWNLRRRFAPDSGSRGRVLAQPSPLLQDPERRLFHLAHFLRVNHACWLWRSTSSIMDSLGEGLGQATLRGLGEAAAEAGFAGGGPFSLKWTILAGTCVYINLVLTSRPPTSAAR
jgi:hypothetical protein